MIIRTLRSFSNVLKSENANRGMYCIAILATVGLLAMTHPKPRAPGIVTFYAQPIACQGFLDVGQKPLRWNEERM